VVTSGTLLLQRQGPLATEEDEWDPSFPRKSEAAGLVIASQDVRLSTLRLPPSYMETAITALSHVWSPSREKKAFQHTSVTG